MAAQVKETKTKASKASKKTSIQISPEESLLLVSKANLPEKLGILNKKPRTSWMLNIENFTFKCLTVQGLVATVFGAVAFINPVIGVGGILLSLTIGIPFGIYFATKERNQRVLEEEYKFNQINELTNADTLVDYLDSNEFKEMVNNLSKLTQHELKILNDHLRDGDLLKDKITLSQVPEDLKTMILASYINDNTSTSKKGVAVADTFYNRITKYVYSFISNASTGPGYAAIITGLTLGALAIAGIGLTSAITGGVTLVAFTGGLAIAAAVSSVLAYFQVKRDQRASKHTEVVNKLEEQQKTITHLKQEVKYINREVAFTETAKNNVAATVNAFTKIFADVPNANKPTIYIRKRCTQSVSSFADIMATQRAAGLTT